MGNVLEVDTATLSLPVSVAGGLWTTRTPLLLGYGVHVIRELWRTKTEPGFTFSVAAFTQIVSVYYSDI